MPHGLVYYRKGFTEEGFERLVLGEVKNAARVAGAVALSTAEKPLTVDKVSFVFHVCDHPLDDLGRDIRVILIHPVLGGDEDAMAAQVAQAIEVAIRDLELPQKITFSVSLCLGKMGFKGVSVIMG